MKYDLGPDAPQGCNDKTGTSGAQAHKKNNEPVCKACARAAAWYSQIRRGVLVADRPRSISSRHKSDYYTFNHGSRWFHTEKDRDDARWRDRTQKAARRAGWPYENVEDLIKFDSQREAIKLQAKKDREFQRRSVANRKEVKVERKVARELVENKLAQGVAVAIKRQRVMSDAEKVVMIRQMIEDRTPIMDFMIRTSQIVGADLKGKK